MLVVRPCTSVSPSRVRHRRSACCGTVAKGAPRVGGGALQGPKGPRGGGLEGGAFVSVAAFSKHSWLRAHHAIMALVGCSPGGCIDTSLTQSDTAKKEPELDPVWDQFERGPEYKPVDIRPLACTALRFLAMVGLNTSKGISQMNAQRYQRISSLTWCKDLHSRRSELSS